MTSEGARKNGNLRSNWCSSTFLLFGIVFVVAYFIIVRTHTFTQFPLYTQLPLLSIFLLLSPHSVSLCLSVSNSSRPSLYTLCHNVPGSLCSALLVPQHILHTTHNHTQTDTHTLLLKYILFTQKHILITHETSSLSLVLPLSLPLVLRNWSTEKGKVLILSIRQFSLNL